MKRTVVAFAAAAMLLTGLSGYGTKERDALCAKVATLVQQLTQVNSDLAAKESELTELRGNLQTAQAQTQAQINSLNADAKLFRTKSELQKVKYPSKKIKKKTS